jgi:DNA topoisomerase-2
VEIHVEQNIISVYNSGDGMPIEIQKEKGVYVLEMIFGHLLTNNNYNDAKKKTT